MEPKTLSEAEKRRLRLLLAQEGKEALAARIGIARQTLVAALAGEAQRAATVKVIRLVLEEK